MTGAADNTSGPVTFPSPAWDRFPEAKDIPDDTLDPGQIELLEQTDAELVEMERLEAVRKRSGIVEDSDAKHEAIIAESD